MKKFSFLKDMGIQLSKFAPAILILLLASHTWAKEPKWLGTWQINLEESDKVSVKYEDGSGTGRNKIFQNAQISVGGLPMPSLGLRVPPNSSMAPKNPEVLLCTKMTITQGSKGVQLLYDDNKKEMLRKGSFRGRDNSWSSKKIQQKYKTPDRKVTKTWTLRPDGRLRVDVKLNPPKERSRTYSRVFDRVKLDAGGHNNDPN